MRLKDDYDDAVSVFPEYIHNSRFGYKVKMAAGVLQIYREMQRHRVKE